MGALHRFDLQPWIDKYQLDNYVETGFGDLTSFKHAFKYPFKKFYGVDLDNDWFENAVRFTNNATFVCDYSTTFLKDWVPKIEGPTLWYLDSHFVASDYKNLPYEESIKKYQRQSLPLEDELRIIKNLRDVSRDVFVIDDFFLYSGDGATEWTKQNPFKYRKLVEDLDIELSDSVIKRILEDTHDFEEVGIDQSYLIATPKS